MKKMEFLVPSEDLESVQQSIKTYEETRDKKVDI